MTKSRIIKYCILGIIAAGIAATILIVGNKTNPNNGTKPTNGPSATDGPTSGPDINESNGLFNYELDGDKATIIGFGEVFEDAYEKLGAEVDYPCFSKGKLVIPGSVDNHPVVAIGAEAFKGDERITGLVITNGVLEICESAFESCEEITDIVFPESLKKIGESAFFGCVKLTVAKLPKSLKTLEGYAFKGCDGLLEISTPVVLDIENVFDSNYIEKVTVLEGVKYIDDSAFETFESMREIVLPSTLELIKDYAFSGCTALEKINFPDSLLNIGENAFEYCESLESIVLPEGLTVLSEYAFAGCTSLKSANIPASCEAIGNCVFDECEELELIVKADSAGQNYAENEEIPYKIQ